MNARAAKKAIQRNASKASVPIRRARESDLDGLIELENRVFSYDVMSWLSARRFQRSASAVLLVAGRADVAGYALVLFRRGAKVARLYSIAVDPRAAGRGIGTALLAAAEAAARRRGKRVMRLEVKAANRKAVRRYRVAGYCVIGRRAGYYDDGGDALRFEKRLIHR